jgi:hypothetical protein
VEYRWWPNQPVLTVTLRGGISNREQAYALAKTIVDQIEGSGYPHVIVILDLTDLASSPAAAALLAGAIPETLKIEHLIMIKAPGLLRLATLPLIQLRGKLHFVDSAEAANSKSSELLPKLPS